MAHGGTLVICPGCASAVRADGGPRCPYCGGMLERPAAEADPPPLAEMDEGLIDSLREAFSYHADALSRPGFCWLSDGGSRRSATGGSSPQPAWCRGQRFGDYEIVGELGRGGMGIVYRARQPALQRDVALKVLPGAARFGRNAVERFTAESRAAARLHHTHVVAIYDRGEIDDQYYYAMELIDGAGLDDVLRERDRLVAVVRHGRLLSASAAHRAIADRPAWCDGDYRRLGLRFAEIADGVAHAHAQGVIHRDIKPHNLLVGEGGTLHLGDFGLARLTDSPHLTVQGEVIGTPAYLAPEQIRGDIHAIDERTDVYALGVTLYEVLTARKPFRAAGRDAVMAAVCEGRCPAPRRLAPSIPPGLETVCLRAMASDPGQRYPSAAELRDDLQRFGTRRPLRSRRPSAVRRAARWARRHVAVVVAGLALGAAGALGAGWTLHADQARQREALRAVTDAYERLATIDYHETAGIPELLAAASAEGLHGVAVDLTQALAALGDNDQAAALAVLEAACHRYPDDHRVQYLTAWALWREGRHGEALSRIASAESLPGDPAPDALFFRGLALHFADPDRAIVAYRAAAQQRAADRGFHAQALLHLARAHNQRLYAQRRLEPFAEAVTTLEALVDNSAYGAYPHYLLSIAHRLAAEIYSGSTGTRDDDAAREHFATALDWARAGQDLDATDRRPLTAEAECLASLGRLSEAEIAYSRALALADSPLRQLAGYHYRWRLRYWLGDHDGALQDLASCAERAPGNRAYVVFYPALVLAERGDLGPARSLAVDAAAAATSAIDRLWAATTLRWLGEPAAAAAVLDDMDDVDFGADLVPPQTVPWMRALVDHGRGVPVDMEALLRDVEQPWRLRGEADFHSAARLWVSGDRTAARTALDRAARCYDSDTRYSYHARVIGQRLQDDRDWPRWFSEIEHE